MPPESTGSSVTVPLRNTMGCSTKQSGGRPKGIEQPGLGLGADVSAYATNAPWLFRIWAKPWWKLLGPPSVPTSTTLYWWCFCAVMVIGKARANNVIAMMRVSPLDFIRASPFGFVVASASAWGLAGSAEFASGCNYGRGRLRRQWRACDLRVTFLSLAATRDLSITYREILAPHLMHPCYTF